ncbi:MAG: hypothetical protein R8M46_03390 [Ghiorsea sp.]
MSLDSKILHQARKAVEKKNVKSWWQLHWLVPTASTAMILLAVTVSLQNRNNEMIYEYDVSTMSDSAQMQNLEPAKRNEEKATSSPAESIKRSRLAQAPAPTTLGNAELRLEVTPQASESLDTEQASFAAKPSVKKAKFRKNSPNTADAINKKRANPTTWLKEIEALLQQGKKTKAREELKAFRVKFPDYEVSKEILSKLNF